MEYTAALEKQIIGRLCVDNPWWTAGKTPDFIAKMKPRLYLDLFYPLATDTQLRRAVILMGQRRVGKTVLMLHTIQKLMNSGVSSQNIIYISVDIPIYQGVLLELLLNLACRKLGKDPLKDPLFVFFDEVQYLKDWEVNMKSLVDTYPNIKFVASGSASAALKRSSNESGAGRFTDFSLPPLTFCEYIHIKGYSDLLYPANVELKQGQATVYNAVDLAHLNRLFIDYINYGGYPEMVLSDKTRENPEQFIRNDIIAKVLLRALPILYGISDVQELTSLFASIAYHSGSQFSYDKLSKESNVRKETLKRYINYLENAFLIKTIRRTDDTAKRYQRETQFKIYLTNPSLRCALFQPISEQDEELGDMVETAVFSQWFPRKGCELRYANWLQGRQQGEVDIVGLDIGRQKPLWAVEVKWSDRYYKQPGELASLQYFMARNKMDCAIVTSLNQWGTLSFGSLTLLFIPAACYAYTVGKNTLLHTKNELGL